MKYVIKCKYFPGWLDKDFCWTDDVAERLTFLTPMQATNYANAHGVLGWEVEPCGT